MWELERAFWIELRNVPGLAELKSNKRTALTAADNRIIHALYSTCDLLPNEVAERSWRLPDAPKTVRVKAKSAYTAEKLVAAAEALHQGGQTPIQVTYLKSPPPQFEEEHKRELLGSDESSDEEGKDKPGTEAANGSGGSASPAPVEEEGPVSWAVERDFWLEVYDVPGIGAPGNFELTQNDSDALTTALAPLLPESANAEMDLVQLVRLRHDSNAIFSARCRSTELVRATLERAKDKAVNLAGLKVRLATRQPRQVRLAIRRAEAVKFAGLMRYKPEMVLVAEDVLERVVCRVTGEPEPELPPEESPSAADDEIEEIQEEKKVVEVIDLDLDSDDETPAKPQQPSITEAALDSIASLANGITPTSQRASKLK